MGLGGGGGGGGSEEAVNFIAMDTMNTSWLMCLKYLMGIW